MSHPTHIFILDAACMSYTAIIRLISCSLDSIFNQHYQYTKSLQPHNPSLQLNAFKTFICFLWMLHRRLTFHDRNKIEIPLAGRRRRKNNHQVKKIAGRKLLRIWFSQEQHPHGIPVFINSYKLKDGRAVSCWTHQQFPEVQQLVWRPLLILIPLKQGKRRKTTKRILQRTKDSQRSHK